MPFFIYLMRSKRRKKFKVNRRRVRWRTRYRKFLSFLHTRFKFATRGSFIKIFASTLILIVLVMAARIYFLGDKFNIDTIEINGVVNSNEDEFENKVNEFYSKNIFLVRTSQIKSKLEGLSIYVESIFVEKDLPDSVVVTVYEKTPSFILINLNGAYLIDDQGLVLDVLAEFSSLNLSQEDIDILRGYGSLSEIEKELEDQSDQPEADEGVDDQPDQPGADEEAGEEEDEIEKTAKEILEENRIEISAVVDQHWQESVDLIEDKYDNFHRVYSYSEKDFEVGDILEEKFTNSTIKVLGIELDDEVHRYIWESEFTFVVQLDRGRRIKFSAKRDFTDQIDDLEVLTYELKRKGKDFRFIDLSSETLVYELEYVSIE